MPITRSNPDVGYFDPEAIGSTLSMVVRAGNTVYLSGLVSATGSGEVVAKGDWDGQVKQVIHLMRELLATENMTLRNVVSTVTYTVDTAKMTAHSAPLAEAFAGHLPTSTYIEVKALASPDYLFEIVVIASDA